MSGKVSYFLLRFSYIFSPQKYDVIFAGVNTSKFMVIFMENYEKTLEYIHSLGMFSHPAGLSRITEVM